MFAHLDLFPATAFLMHIDDYVAVLVHCDLDDYEEASPEADDECH